MDVEDTFGESEFIPDELKENYEVELPDWFWDRMGVKINIEKTEKVFSYYDNDKNPPIVYLADKWSGYERTILTWKSSIIHELGHAFHYRTKLISDESAKSSVKEFYKKGKEMVKDFTSKQLKILDSKSFSSNFKQLKEKYKSELTEADVRRLFAVTSDLFASLTGGDLGFGHAKSYWADAIRKYQEFFANSIDIYLNGNLILQDSFPEIVELIEKYWQNEKQN